MAVKTLLDPLNTSNLPQSNSALPSRERSTWAYKDEEDRYFFGIRKPLEIPEHPTDQLHVIAQKDVARPDLLAYKYYGTPRFYWAILSINGIMDPFEGMTLGKVLRIPSTQRLAQYGVR